MTSDVTSEVWTCVVERAIKDSYGDTKTRIDIDPDIMIQCLDRAEITLRLYVLENPSCFRHAGNFCYWLRKLKPFRIKAYKGYKPDEVANHYLNELIAFHTAIRFILSAQDDQITAAEEAGSLRGNFKEIFEWRNRNFINMREDIVASLRFHTHSSESLPLLFEALMRLPTDPIH